MTWHDQFLLKEKKEKQSEDFFSWKVLFNFINWESYVIQLNTYHFHWFLITLCFPLIFRLLPSKFHQAFLSTRKILKVKLRKKRNSSSFTHCVHKPLLPLMFDFLLMFHTLFWGTVVRFPEKKEIVGNEILGKMKMNEWIYGIDWWMDGWMDELDRSMNGMDEWINE